MRKTLKKYAFKNQHTQLGFINLGVSEPSHLFSFSYISYPTCIQNNWTEEMHRLAHVQTRCVLKNSIRNARTPQPGERVFNTMRYRSRKTVHRLGHFKCSVIVQIMFK